MYQTKNSPGRIRNFNPAPEARFDPQLTVNLQQPQLSPQQQLSPALNASEYVSTRKNSTASVASLGYQSMPHTPVNQKPPPPGNVYMHHFGSISSVCTTDDEDFNETTQTWLPEHDALLAEQFRAYTDDPTTAPFSGRFPPSGVIQRVAKNTIKAAAMQRVSFPHSARAVRRRLLQLSALEAENVGPDALNSTNRTPAITSFGEGYFGSNSDLGPEALALLAEADGLAALESATENVSLLESAAPIGQPDSTMSSIRGASTDRPSRLRAPPLDLSFDDRFNSNCEEDFNFEETPRARKSWRQGAIPRDFSNVPLASPYKEAFQWPNAAPFGSPAEDADIEGFNDDVLNLVAKRKRDSLRMKRGARPA